MIESVKRLAAWLPENWQRMLKRRYYAWQISHSRFRADEPEFDRLTLYLSPGDVAIDVGAHIGHYTVTFSRLVGDAGRVIAFEPVCSTFATLTANIQFCKAGNVTLLNLAASDQPSVVGMDIPTSLATGRPNFYQARITASSGAFRVLSVPLDALCLPPPVTLVKIDAEGHELPVLKGMTGLIGRDHPVLIVEGDDESVFSFLRERGYTRSREHGSPNSVFRKSSDRINP